MSSRKFVIYKVKIVYGDGAVEYRNDAGYALGNYSDMESLYYKVQKEVCDKDCKVVFSGVNFKGDSKVIKKKDFSKASAEEQRIYETSFVEYANQIKDILNKIKMKKDYHLQMLDAAEKKDSIIDHRIETFKNKSWINEEEMIQEKIKIFDESESIKKERRYHKDEVEMIYGITSKVNLNDISRAFDISNKDNSKFKYLDDEMVKSLGLMKEVYYSNEKDRLHKQRLYSKKYDKVKVDYKRNVLVCYNKARVRI